MGLLHQHPSYGAGTVIEGGANGVAVYLQLLDFFGRLLPDPRVRHVLRRAPVIPDRAEPPAGDFVGIDIEFDFDGVALRQLLLGERDRQHGRTPPAVLVADVNGDRGLLLPRLGQVELLLPAERLRDRQLRSGGDQHLEPAALGLDRQILRHDGRDVRLPV